MLILGSTLIGAEWTVAIEYDDCNNAIYVGEAAPGTAKDKAAWRIKYLTYDASNNCTDVQWASGNAHFDKVWNDRANYSYS